MNKLQKQINKCMSSIDDDSGNLVADFTFPSSFTGFKGHFPDNPILPGICMIQSVLLMLMAFNRKHTHIKQIVQAKFFTTVTCNEECQFELSESKADNGNMLVKAYISRGDEKIARIDLLVANTNGKTK